MKAHFTLAVALLLICTGTGAALVQIPEVCDAEHGAAFGLCTAYCQAMDCDSDAPEGSATACSRVRGQFQNITGRDLPCEAPLQPCPCANLSVNPVFSGIIVGGLPIDLCSTIFISGEEKITLSNEDPATGISAWAGYDDVTDTYSCGSQRDGSLILTPEAAAFCIDLLEQAAAIQGVTCVPE